MSLPQHLNFNAMKLILLVGSKLVQGFGFTSLITGVKTMKKKSNNFKEIIIKVDKLPQQVMDQVGELAERVSEAVCQNELNKLRMEIRKEITELKTELFKAGMVPSYTTAYKKYDAFEDVLINEKFDKMLQELTLKTGRSPRALRIRIKTLGILGV
jgi:aconitase B